jgi:hypothetical protein
VSLNCLRTVVFVSKSQSSLQVTETELSQIGKFKATESNLETDPMFSELLLLFVSKKI